MSDPNDRRGSGFNDRQLGQLHTMVDVCVQERLQERSAEEIEEIAEKAATKAIEKLTDEAYRAVGKTILQKLYWMVGALVVAGYFWAQTKGWMKP